MPEIIVKCGKCLKEVDDDSSSSISCDICSKWYHSDKLCSGLKKTLFINIKKNDQWACPVCIAHFQKVINDPTDRDEILAHKAQIDLLTKQNLDLTEKVGRLENELNKKEIEIIQLKDRGGKPNIGEEPWTIVRGTWPGDVKGRRRSDSALHASNRFEVLKDAEPAPTPPWPPMCSDFPPLGSAKGKGGKKGGGRRPGPDSSKTQKKFRTIRNGFTKPRQNKNRMFLVADSHGRTCADRLQEGLGDWEIGSSVLPGAPMPVVLDEAATFCKEGEAKKGDFLVLVGGTNHINEDSLEELEDRFDTLVEGPGSVLWVETPMRYDAAYENKIIVKQNEVIKQACIKNKWNFLGINSILDRSCYTEHGLHLNWRGKKVLCDLIENFFNSIYSEPAQLQKNGQHRENAGKT